MRELYVHARAIYTHRHTLTAQSYKKKCTFASFLTKKYAAYCILQCAVTHLGSHKGEFLYRAKYHVSGFFRQKPTSKCSALPRSNFEVGLPLGNVGVLEVTKKK